MRGSSTPVRMTLVALATVTACNSPRASEIRELSARVDSMAIALDSLASILGKRATGEPNDGVATVSTTGAAVLGSPDAPVTIVEFTDYQCPYCRRHARETLPQLQRDLIATGQVRYVIRDLPLPIHPFAEKNARAARCAGQQQPELYWSLHDSLFAASGPQTPGTLPRLAKRLGLKQDVFAKCMDSPGILHAVALDKAEAAARSLVRTPSFVIGPTKPDSIHGTVLGGAYPLAVFASTVKKVLQENSPKPKESR